MKDKGGLLAETQKFFDDLEARRSSVFELKKKLLQVIDLFMLEQNADNLITVKNIFDSLLKSEVLGLDAELLRFYYIFNILLLEENDGDIFFSNGLSNHKELMDRYILSIFALRRIELDKSELFTNEAVQMLADIQISAMAVDIIEENEVLVKTDKINAVLKERGLLC